MLAAAIAAFAVAGRKRPHSASVPGAAEIPADPKAAYERAVKLTLGGRPEEAIPYYRGVIAARPGVWQVRADYASALMNSAGESRVHRGVAGPRMRSSFERVERMKAAFAEADRAEALANTPRGHAYVMALRGQALANWGLAWNAILEYGHATEQDSTLAAARRDGFTLMSIMRTAAGESPVR